MIRYGEEKTFPMRVQRLIVVGEQVRQWWNATITFEWGPDMEFPEGLVNPSVVMMVTPSGELIDSVILSDGTDSEFVLEEAEKIILLAHVKFHLNEWIGLRASGGDHT